MFANPMEVKRRLMREYELSGKHAEAIIDAFSSAEGQVTTKTDLGLMEERLNHRLWRAAVTIITVQSAVTGLLLNFFA